MNSVFKEKLSTHGIAKTAVEPLAVFIIGMLSSIAWALYAGPDMNWDFLHYHLYAGLHSNGNALSRDFFPAGSQSYFTPYGYWPMAVMIAAKWPAMLVGASMAAIHSLAVLGTWYLSKQLFPDDSRKSVTLRALATILGVANSMVLTQVGTSYLDLTTAILGVFGVAFLLKAVNHQDARSMAVFASGLCFGIATALKFTNAAFAVAAFLVMTILVCFRSDLGWRVLASFCAAGAAGFLAAYGPWGYQLWREFGNPFFPFFNSFFQPAVAPVAAAQVHQGFQLGGLLDAILSYRSGLHHRYLPGTVSEWFLRPLYMLDPVFNVYTETRAPDARFFALFCLAPFALWKVRAQGMRSNLALVLLYFAIAWMLWMGASGNGRYMMTLILLAGPALVACANECWQRSSLTALAAITLFVCVQGTLVGLSSDFRTAGTEWHDQWISDGLPREVTERPVTFVSFVQPTVSWFSAFAHPQSRFVALPRTFPGSGAYSDRIANVLSQSDRIIAVFGFRLIDRRTGKPLPAAPGAWRVDAEQNGFSVDFDTCLIGRLYESPPPIDNYVLVTSSGERIESYGTRGFFFCRATFKPELRKQVAPSRVHEALFDKIEAACPRMYFPKGASTDCTAGTCRRVYDATDSYVRIDADGVVRSGRFGAVDSAVWGTVDELSRDSAIIDCHQDVGRHVPWSPGQNMFPGMRSSMK